MENRILGKKVIFWIQDPKSLIAMSFYIDINNIFPALRRARIKFLRYWLMCGGLRRQPKLWLFFEAPEGNWAYVRDWVLGENGNRQILALKKEKLADPEKIILAVLDAYQRYEQRCQEHEAQKAEFPCRAQLHLVSSK
jgi:hypothetical protein